MKSFEKKWGIMSRGNVETSIKNTPRFVGRRL